MKFAIRVLQKVVLLSQCRKVVVGQKNTTLKYIFFVLSVLIFLTGHYFLALASLSIHLVRMFVYIFDLSWKINIYLLLYFGYDYIDKQE